MLKVLRLLLLAFFAFSQVSGQQYSFIQLSIEDGLAQSQVRSLCQDYRGFIWMATMGGVSRFDGTRFINFSTDQGMLDNQVNCIYEDSAKDLWFGCAGGISRFNGRKFEKFPFDTNSEKYMALDLIEIEPGILLIATNGAGLFRFKVSSGKYENVNSLKADGFIRCLLRQQDGRIIIGTRSGLYQSEGSNLEELNTLLSGVSVSDVVIDGNGQLSIATFGDGIFIQNKTEQTHLTQQTGLLSNAVRELSIDDKGNLWVACKEGVNKIQNGEVVLSLTVKNGLEYDNIKTIYCDKQQNLWLGTDGKGVYRYTGEDFVFFSRQDKLSSDIVMAIEPAANGKLWMGTYDNGACIFGGTDSTNYTVENGLLSNTVWALEVDNNGNTWFGTNIGISKFNGKSFTNFVGPSEESSFERVTAIHESTDGKIWFGVVDGIAVFDNESFSSKPYVSNFPGTRVRSIFEAKNGILWFGAENGLIRKKKDVYDLIEVPNGLKNSVVYNIGEDQFENLWVGTKRGLFVLKGDSLVEVVFSEGFGSNTINFIQFDEGRFLYIGTNNGLFILDTDIYTKENRIALKHFTDQEGLVSLECNQNAAFIDDKGKLWFGTSEGVVRYENIRDPFAEIAFQPLVHINNVSLLLESINWDDFADSVDVKSGLPVGLELEHTNNHLTFEFVGIYYANPSKIVYQYMLEGVDEYWLPETSTNYATYASLTQGNYTFKVRAKIRGGLWSQNVSQFSFVIKPPFYKTWWFITILVALALMSVAIIVRGLLENEKRKRRTQQLEYTSRMLALEQQTLNSSMNRHFIFNALNSIQYYINRQDKTSANKYLSSFAKLIRKNLDSSQSNFTSLADEIERMELYLSLENMRFQEKFEYSLTVDPNIDTHSVQIPAMIFQPYLENSIWHGILPMDKKGHLKVEISRKENDALIRITDDGIGLEAAKKSRENSGHQYLPQGMLITSNRINLFRKMTNQNFKIVGPQEYSLNGKVGGTVVEITFPLKTELENSSVLF